MSGVGAVRRRNIIDPEDQAFQEEVSRRLTVLRRERYGATEFAALVGITHNNLHQFEHYNSGNMSLLLVERRAAPVGLRLELVLEDLREPKEDRGLLEEVEEDLEVMILATQRLADTVEARAKATALLTSVRLNVARVATGVTSYGLADRMGVTQATVSELFRAARATSRIASFQRIARALELRVVPRLVPLEG
jgi:DNA-binding transcriptional regulator YiaG